MISRHFALNSELSGAIAKRLPHAKNQPSAPGSCFNQFVTDIYIYIQSSSFNSKDIYIHIHNNRVLIVRINRLSTMINKQKLRLSHIFMAESTSLVFKDFVKN